MADLFDFRPDLGASTPEASLREILFRYYRPYFGEDQSIAYVNQFIMKVQAVYGTSDKASPGPVDS
jgi:hypothetical protein